MKIISLSTNEINQNGYHFNKLTRNKIGFIYTAPIKIVPDDCLACDGYVLKIEDYKKLYSVIGSTFNNGDESEDEFRIPDYNVTKRFLQPSQEVANLVEAGLPNITGEINVRCNFDVATGAFYSEKTSCLGHNSNYSGNGTAKFDASRSSSVYGKSTTVQPPSQTVHLCIKYK